MESHTESNSAGPVEIAHVLFTDIVGFGPRPLESQKLVVNELQELVLKTGEFNYLQANGQLIFLPTGDGIALVFFGDPEAPAKCALNLGRALRIQRNFELRMGIHTGPVCREKDINGNLNVLGPGINDAQRVMGCGDGGHILVSREAAVILNKLSAWSASLHDLGEVEVKHRVRLRLYNLYTDNAGNRELPQMIRTMSVVAKMRRFIFICLETLFRSRKSVPLYTAVLFAMCFLSDFTPIRLCETVRVWVLGPPKQERMVSDALKAFDRHDFQDAIARSKDLIVAYEPSARLDQGTLEAGGAQQWPTGKVPRGRIWESMAILERGSLNSVALAWWITGRSQQGLDHPCEAKEAFEAAARYSYARTWDPQSWPIRGWSPYGWFWSPPDDARDRARSLTCR